MNELEQKVVPFMVAEDIKETGFFRETKLFWYTDIQEVGEMDEDGKEFAIPAYSDEELSLILPVNVEVNGKLFYRYDMAGYDYTTGQELFKTFYGNSENDQFPLIYAQSTKNKADAQGKTLLLLIARGMVN